MTEPKALSPEARVELVAKACLFGATNHEVREIVNAYEATVQALTVERDEALEQIELLKDRVWLLENETGQRTDDPDGAPSGKPIPIFALMNAPNSTFKTPALRPVRERRLEAEARALLTPKDTENMETRHDG